MSRRVIVIEWSEPAARAWWKSAGHSRARFPGIARAFMAMLREWVLDQPRSVLTLASVALLLAEHAPAARAPMSATVRVLTPAHIRTTVHATAPPSPRRDTVGRNSFTP